LDPVEPEKPFSHDPSDPMLTSTTSLTLTDWEETANMLFSTTFAEDYDPFHLNVGWEDKRNLM
jgi:hypothetical protein